MAKMKKNALTDSIISTDNAFFKTLDRSDIEALFS